MEEWIRIHSKTSKNAYFRDFIFERDPTSFFLLLLTIFHHFEIPSIGGSPFEEVYKYREVPEVLSVYVWSLSGVDVSSVAPCSSQQLPDYHWLLRQDTAIRCVIGSWTSCAPVTFILDVLIVVKAVRAWWFSRSHMRPNSLLMPYNESILNNITSTSLLFDSSLIHTYWILNVTLFVNLPLE